MFDLLVLSFSSSLKTVITIAWLKTDSFAPETFIQNQVRTWVSEKYRKKLEDYRDNIEVLYLNCRSLNMKKNYLDELMRERGYNIIYGLSETWFKNSNDYMLWTLSNKQVTAIGCDRSTEGSEINRGGGVMIFNPKNLKPKLR